MATLIEKNNITRDYGFSGIEAVIDHPKHGKLLICDGYGGEDTLSGGAVRFRHGIVAKLKPEDTLGALKGETWNDGMSRFDAVIAGYDPERQVLPWDGSAVASVAKSVGLAT